jgi:ribosomal protein S18 acetylase RimI-like enzyme
MKRLIKESGIRDINLLAKRYKKAKIYFHQDLDGVTTALAMKNYLEQKGINVVDAEVIQYGDKEFAIKKPEGSGEVMPVLVDFAHGKPMFVIHTDHHDSQAGVEKDTATNFKSSRSNVETISQSISPKEIFTSEDIFLISTVDSANFATNNITPEMVMNYLFKYDKDESLKKNKLLMGLVVNKLLLAYKNKPNFLEDIVLNTNPSLLSILNFIRRVAIDKGYATPEQMTQNKEKYVQSRKEGGVNIIGNIISQYGFGSTSKPGSYDRYTPFRNNPDADFLVTGMPMGMVQASCNPFKKERALKGVDLGEIKDEVLEVFSEELRSQKITFGTLKKLSEMDTKYNSVGFTFKDMWAIYGNMPSFKIQGDYGNLKDILSNISNRLYRSLTEKQRSLLNKVSVNGLDVIKANSGGHKCITNISGISYLYSGKKEEGDRRYVDLVKDIQKTFVNILNGKIKNQGNNINEGVNNVNKPFFYEKRGKLTKSPGMNIKYLTPENEEVGFCNLLDFENAFPLDWDVERFYNDKDKFCKNKCEDGYFNKDNALYLHDLRVHDSFMGNGYSKKLMKKSHDIAKNNGYVFVTLITSRDNNVAQNLYKKLGYKLHQTDGVKDFFYKQL